MKPQGAHLVGSVPLAGSGEVFSAVAQGLGSRLKRIPDGETGPRSNWIAWQLAVFEKMPQLESDSAIEFGVLEGVMPTMFRNAPEEIFRRLTAYGNWVPRAVELGYHLCYGDSGHKHFKEPADAGWLVRVANHLAAHLERPLDF